MEKEFTWREMLVTCACTSFLVIASLLIPMIINFNNAKEKEFTWREMLVTCECTSFLVIASLLIPMIINFNNAIVFQFVI
jgi:competence protein ComGC